MKMITTEVKERIENNNKAIDEYLNVTLPKIFGKKTTDTFGLSEWIPANEMYCNQGFYESSYALLKELREQGYDVKINMQSFKLVMY